MFCAKKNGAKFALLRGVYRGQKRCYAPKAHPQKVGSDRESVAKVFTNEQTSQV